MTYRTLFILPFLFVSYFIAACASGDQRGQDSKDYYTVTVEKVGTMDESVLIAKSLILAKGLGEYVYSKGVVIDFALESQILTAETKGIVYDFSIQEKTDSFTDKNGDTYISREYYEAKGKVRESAFQDHFDKATVDNSDPANTVYSLVPLGSDERAALIKSNAQLRADYLRIKSRNANSLSVNLFKEFFYRKYRSFGNINIVNIYRLQKPVTMKKKVRSNRETQNTSSSKASSIREAPAERKAQPDRVIHTGKRGGRYYINEKGKKVYVK